MNYSDYSAIQEVRDRVEVQEAHLIIEENDDDEPTPKRESKLTEF